MRVLVCVVFAIVGCASDGRPIADWTFDAPGGPHASITLPNTLRGVLGARSSGFTLRRQLVVDAPERGRTLTLGVNCFHGPLALAVDGVSIPDFGDLSVGEHRFVIPSALTDRAALELDLTGTRDWQAYTGAGFGTAPRLAVGATGQPSAVATFNRALAVAGLAVMVLLGAIFGVMFLLDRSRRENGAAAGAVLATVPMFFAYQLGGLPWGSANSAVVGVVSAINYAATLWFICFAFEVGRASRVWLTAFATFGVAKLGSVLSLEAAAFIDRATAPIGSVWLLYMLVMYLRLARRGAHRADGLTLLVAFGIGVSGSILDLAVPLLIGYRPWDGAHVFPIGMISIGLGLSIVLARQHVARRRVVERTADELRHQVAARTRELADALARVSQGPSSVEPNRMIDGRYRVIRHLGAGGMGSIYEVERVSDRQRFALKTIRGHVDAHAMARFAREASIAASLDHPNLVPVLDVGIAEGGLFLVMPLVVGGSLDREHARFGNVSWGRPLLAQIASGLRVLHERGIVHRDLKPGNILIGGDVARIADFGLASLGVVDPLAASTFAPDESPLTQAGQIFGTPRYMAPELAEGVRDAAPSSDVFAFGVIACELLAGGYPFAEPPITARRTGRALPEPITQTIDPVLRAIVERCLDPDPARRPAAVELVATFRDI